MSKVHESSMYKSTIEVIKAIVRLQTYGLFELSKGVIDLIEHHHAVAPICVVLRIFVIEADSCAKVIHGLLVVTGGHESIASISVIFCVS